MHRTLRYLRIAFSATCVIVAMLLCALWVRNHYSVDQIFLPINRSAFVAMGSVPDAIVAGVTGKSPTGTWGMLNMPSDEWLAAVENQMILGRVPSPSKSAMAAL